MTFADDLTGALGAESAIDALRELDARSLLTAIIPELESGRGFAQPELHHYTVLEHNLAAVEAVEVASGDTAAGRELRAILGWLDLDESLDREIEGVPVRTLLRLACLVHDVAKPHTATEMEGRLRFPRHGPTGAELMQVRLPEAGFGPLTTDFVARLVRNHLRPGVLVRPWPPTERAVR
ncbi:MAG TPA: HD domain-containing protein, partial [Tepidiformaceae bacterium]|nr:HD domain-containing protein [Tepidiformaceae bacterium]